MDIKLFIIDCEKECNFEYCDNFDLVQTANNILENKQVEKVETIILKDDYVEYLKSHNVKDSDFNRLAWYMSNKTKDYEKEFEQSIYSIIVDNALLPIVFSCENPKKDIIETVLTNEQCKSIEKILKDSFGNVSDEVIVAPTLMDLTSKVSEYETELVDEILMNKDYGIIETAGKIYTNSESVFYFGYYYVISKKRLPRIFTKENIKPFIDSKTSIINFDIPSDSIDDIIGDYSSYIKNSVMLDKLIYPDEINTVIGGWLDYLRENVEEKLKNINKLNELKNMHKKPKKNKKSN